MVHFKTEPHRFSIGLAPTSRARCRACKQRLARGEPRVQIHAFVRPGRAVDFFRHARCVGPRLAAAIAAAHGALDRVPLAPDVDEPTARAARDAVARSATRA